MNIQEAIDKMKENFKVRKTKSVGGIRTHPNCRCTISNGQWILHNDDKLCEVCIRGKKLYESNLARNRANNK